MRLASSMKAAVSARLAEAARVSTIRRSRLRMTRRERPVTSATMSVPKRCELFDQSVTALDGFTAFDRLAVTIDGSGTEVALGIGEGLVELDREGMGEIVEYVLARGNVDLHIAPVLGRNLREPALHESLAGRDDLDHGGVAGVEIALDRADQRGRLHRGQQMPEEALLGALEGGTGGGLGLRIERAGLAGNVRRPHGRVEVVMDD